MYHSAEGKVFEGIFSVIFEFIIAMDLNIKDNYETSGILYFQNLKWLKWFIKALLKTFIIL